MTTTAAQFPITAYEVGILWQGEWYWGQPRPQVEAVLALEQARAEHPESTYTIRKVHVSAL